MGEAPVQPANHALLSSHAIENRAASSDFVIKIALFRDSLARGIGDVLGAKIFLAVFLCMRSSFHFALCKLGVVVVRFAVLL
jgi:hypothetical protein